MNPKRKEELNAKWKAVATQAVTDGAFKNKLVTDPVGVMKEHGWFGLEHHRWKELFGLPDEKLVFFAIHEEADIEHSDLGWNTVVEHAARLNMEDAVVEACRTNLMACWQSISGSRPNGDERFSSLTLLFVVAVIAAWLAYIANRAAEQRKDEQVGAHDAKRRVAFGRDIHAELTTAGFDLKRGSLREDPHRGE